MHPIKLMYLLRRTEHVSSVKPQTTRQVSNRNKSHSPPRLWGNALSPLLRFMQVSIALDLGSNCERRRKLSEVTS